MPELAIYSSLVDTLARTGALLRYCGEPDLPQTWFSVQGLPAKATRYAGRQNLIALRSGPNWLNSDRQQRNAPDVNKIGDTKIHIVRAKH